MLTAATATPAVAVLMRFMVRSLGSGLMLTPPLSRPQISQCLGVLYGLSKGNESPKPLHRGVRLPNGERERSSTLPVVGSWRHSDDPGTGGGDRPGGHVLARF